MALGEERFVGLAADFEGKLRMKNAILFIGRNMKEDVVTLGKLLQQVETHFRWKNFKVSILRSTAMKATLRRQIYGKMMNFRLCTFGKKMSR